MPYALLLALAFLTPAPCLADDGGPTALVSTDRVLSAVIVDLNHDGQPDQALLVRGQRGADLLVNLSAPNQASPRRIQGRFAAFLGKRLGMLPSLEGAGTDKLRLKSANDVLGRARFEQTLELSMIDNQLMVSSLTYQQIDPGSPEHNGNCELDLVNQTGHVNSAAVIPSVRPAPIETWDVLSPPAECLF